MKTTVNTFSTRQVARPSHLSLSALCRLGIGMSALLVLSSGSVFAQRINVMVNGQPVVFSGLGPLQVQGRTLVPVRGVLEKLGAEVAWVPSTRSVVATTASMDIELHLGDRQAMVNGKSVTLDVPAQEIEGHTMVPLRFLGEALGGTVKWNDATRTVTIVTDGQPHNDIANTNPPAQAVNAADPKIERITFKADDWYGWLQPGHSVSVELTGTPRGEASFRVPGLTEAVSMKETQPGKYVGSWTAPTTKAVQLKEASVIGELKIGGKASPAMQAEGRLSVDSKPPTILDRLPEPDTKVTTGRPNITVAFEDQGSGIWPPSMRLVVNGQDVSKEARVTGTFVSYTPSDPLPPGETRVILSINDKATNEARTEWKFDVLASDGSAGIRSLKNNAGKTLEPGDVLHVDMEGLPGGSAVFSLGNIKGVKLTESPAGHYSTDYTIRKGDDVQNATLSTRLTLPDGQKFTRQADKAISVNTGKPTAPVITFPTKSDPMTSPLVIRGKAAPHTQVRVKVDYSSKVLGLLPVQGTAADSVVTADGNGNWKTEPIDLKNLFSNRNVDYTISATAVSATDEKSDTTQFRFKLR